MLFLLRQIRRKTLMDNKFTTYFLYAIGEIILVVIGILIAISIDDWNESKNERAREQIILRQLKVEYQKNLEQLEQKMVMRNEMLEAATRLLRFKDETSAKKDSLLLCMSSLMRDPTFDPIQNDLIASGNLRLIRNDTLRQMLANWTSDILQVQEVEKQWQEVRTGVVIPSYLKMGILRDITDQIWKDGYTPVEALDQTINIQHRVNPSKNGLTAKEMLEHDELEGIASLAITFCQIGNIQSQALRDRIINIDRLITEGIDK
ncbi:DUF6090 family protein [Ekhidna sp.]|uniref:DUF6090 family protein n=1 Tax=Ekhidna sp. TaxID=2608089 RepID=UPI003518245B